MTFRLTLTAVLVTTAVLAQENQPANDEEARWWGHVKTLADDSMEGRQTGSEGYRKAAAYVTSQFEKIGLKPAGTKGFAQAVAFEQRRILEDKSQLALVRDGKEDVLRFGDDVTVNLRAELAPSVEAPLVFAGYGLSAPDAGLDDLKGLDLKGTIAVYIAGTPASITGALAAHYQQAGVRWQALKAAGAIGSIAIPNPKTSEQPWERTALSRLNPVMTLVDPRFNDLAGMQVGATMNPASAGRLFAGSGHTLEELFASVDAKKALPRFALPASFALDSQPLQSDNIVGVLPGSDPGLAREHVVLTAHLDHVGIGAPIDGDRIYNGAMDNASGIATLIEVARALSSSTPRPKRSIVFAAVTAEEHGLLGSRYFAGDPAGEPTVPKSSIVANINMDMFLPLYPMTSVMVLGLDESDLGDRVREVAKRQGLAVNADPQPQRNRFTRSDQYSFIRQGVPALALKVGFAPGSPQAEIDEQWTKERYHAPSDDLQQPIDLGAAVTFTRLVAALSAEIANHPARPRWKPTSFFRRFAVDD